MTDHFSPSLKLYHKSHLIKLNGNWMTLIMQRIKMKDALSQSLTTCNDVFWPMWQILRASRRSMIILPIGIKNKRATTRKTFCSLQLWHRFNQHIYTRGPRVWLEAVSQEGPRKAKPVARENSGTRIDFSEVSKTILQRSTYYTPSIYHTLWTRYKDALPGTCKGLGDPKWKMNRCFQEKF